MLLRALVVASFLLAGAGCPPSPGTIDAGAVDDAGTAHDAGALDDAGAVDAGRDDCAAACADGTLCGESAQCASGLCGPNDECGPNACDLVLAPCDGGVCSGGPCGRTCEPPGPRGASCSHYSDDDQCPTERVCEDGLVCAERDFGKYGDGVCAPATDRVAGEPCADDECAAGLTCDVASQLCG